MYVCQDRPDHIQKSSVFVIRTYSGVRCALVGFHLIDCLFDCPEFFPIKMVDEVMEFVEYYLGYADLSNGTCITGWKLMVVMGDRD